MNMRFIRKAQRKFLLRERAVDVLSKVALIGISILACLWMVSGAHAAGASITGIKGQAMGDGSYTIDFSLSQKIGAENVSVEFERNFIQVSLKGVSAYPARTENLNEGTFEKVFTYQYQPDLARARVLLKSASAAIKNKASWKVTPEGLRVTVAGTAAKTVSDVVKSKAASVSEIPAASSDADDERIVQQILIESKGGTSAAAPLASASAPKVSEDKPLFSDKKPVAASSEEQTLFSPKTSEEKPKEGTATRVVASLLLVIGVIGACAVAFRRFTLGKGPIFPRQNRVIEVVASQGLGPKRSVALIKVLDQYMVVGMAGEGMSLLANLGSDVKIEKYLDQIGGPGTSFTDSLEGALAGVTAAGKTDTAGPPLTPRAAQNELVGIRTSIKKRLAGFKPL